MFATVAACVGLIGSSFTVDAHLASDWYGPKWTTGTIGGIATDRTVEFRFVDNFPDGNERLRVQDGKREWNDLATSMSFHYESTEPDFATLDFGNCADVYQNDKVGWEQFGGSGFDPDNENLAVVAACSISGHPNAQYDFKIKVNKDVPWYGGTDGVPDGKWDLWSTLSHEFGHAGGRLHGGPGDVGHWSELSGLCPGPSESDFGSRHTMCPKIFDGTSMQRTLAEHDKDTFRNAY